jgi:RHS repeat-associated protein
MYFRIRTALASGLALAMVVSLLVVVPLPAVATPTAVAGATGSAPHQLIGRAHAAGPVDTRARVVGPIAPASRVPVPGAVGAEPRFADVPYPAPQRSGPQRVQLTTGSATAGYVAGKSRELLERRTARSTVYANPDGTQTLRVYEQDVFVRRPTYEPRVSGDGDTVVPGRRMVWVPVDTTLHPRDSDGRLVAGTPAGVSLAPRGRDPRLAELDLGASAADPGGFRAGFGVDEAADVPATIGPAGARYAGIRPGADIVLTAAPDGVKEQIVLRSPASPASWAFPLALKAVTPRLDPVTGGVLLLDSAGTVRGVIPAGFMADSSVDPHSGEPARSDGVRYALERRGSTWVLRVELDRAWLLDHSRQYPVTVDPSIRQNSDSDDTFVSSHNFANRDNSQEADLVAGTYNGGGEKRASYLQFRPAFSALTNKYILGASLNLWNFWSYSCQARPVTVYRVTQPWSGPSTTTWPGPAYDAASPVASKSFAHGYSACPGGAWESLPISADRFTRWVHGIEPFYGFALRASDSDSYGWKRFGSAQYGNAEGRPFLDVTYSDYAATYELPTAAFDPPVTGSTAGGITVRVTNWGSDVWTATNGFRLVYTLLSSDGRVSVGPVYYAMPRDVGPHQSVDVRISVGPTPVPGTYTMTLDMLNPAGAWFGPSFGSPRGTLSFSTVNGPPTINGQYPLNNGSVSSLSPTLWAGYYDPDNYPGPDDRRLLFEVCGGTPEAPQGCRSSGWINELSWPVPAGMLDWNRPAFWYVTVTDSLLQSPRIGPFWFTPTIEQPAVTGQLGGSPADGDMPGLDPQTGNYSTTSVDATVNVAGPDLQVARTYNSRDPRVSGAFGAGWTSSLDQRLVLDSDGSGNAVVTMATGQTVRFGRRPDGSFSPPAGLNLTLVRVAATAQDPEHWLLRDAKGGVRTFDAGGRLSSVEDADGRTQLYFYESDGTLARVTDTTSGRTLRITWSVGHVATVATDPPAVGQPAPMWTYTYTGDRLTRACSPLSAQSCTSYGYTDSSYYRSVVLDDRPTGYWPLGETSGTAAANVAAEVPGQYDALYQGAVLGEPGALAASGDTAARFTGTNGSIVRLPDNVLNRSQGMTVELWFKANPGAKGVVVSTQERALESGSWGVTSSVVRVSAGGRLVAHLPTTEGCCSVSTVGRVDNGQWHHVVLTGELDVQRLYLDGAFVGEDIGGELSIADDTHAFLGTGWLFGIDGPGGVIDKYLPFTGSIDEVAYYSRPLGQTEVAEHWAARMPVGLLTTITEPGNFVATTVRYDVVSGRASEITDRHGATWSLSAPTIGDGTRSVTLGSNARSSIAYTYDTRHNGRLVRRQDGFGVRTWDYNAAGFVSRVTDENGLRTDFDTDARGNVLARTTCRTVASCQTEYFGYFLDAANPLDPRNDVQLWRADARSSSATDPTYRVTRDIDAAGRTVKATYPLTSGSTTNPVETFTYSTNGMPAEGGGLLPAGLLLSTTATNGGQTRFFYNGKADLVRVTDPVDLNRDRSYDDLGRRTAEAIWATVDGRRVDFGQVTYTYTGTSLPATIAGPATTNEVTGQAHTPRSEYTYDAMGHQVQLTVSDQAGVDATRTWKWSYDPAGRLSSTTTPDNATTNNAWDRLGNLVKVTRPDSIATEYVYDDEHRVLETAAVGAGVDPADPAATRFVVETRGYDPAGRLASIVDGNGRQTDLHYFDDGRLQSVVRKVRNDAGVVVGESVLQDWTYDPAGRVERAAGYGVPTTQYTYDPRGYVATTVADPGGTRRKTTFVNNTDGTVRRATRSDAGTRTEVVDFAYDAAGRRISEQVDNTGGNPAALLTTYTRDPRGFVAKVTDPTGVATAFEFDTVGRLRYVVEAPRAVWTNGVRTVGVSPVTTLGRNTFGEIVDVRDPAGADTHTVTDAMGRYTEVRLPAYTPPGGAPINATTRLEYNRVGLLASQTDPLGAVTSNAYDPYGRLVTRTTADPDGTGPKPAAVWRTAYNRSGEPAESTDPVGGRSLMTWNDLGRPATLSQSERQGAQTLFYTTRFDYDAMGYLTKITSPLGNSTAAAYNGAGDLTRATDATGRFVETQYDLAGRPLTVRRGRAGSTDTFVPVMHAFRYDKAGRLVGEDDCAPSPAPSCATPSRSTGYTYDAAGRLTQRNSPQGRITGYTYDTAGQPVTVAQLVNPSDPASAVAVSRGYDAAGRQTHVVDGNGRATDYTYNSWGLPESTIEPSTAAHPQLADRTWTTNYDAAGRPIQEKLPGGVVRQRTFDALGRPVRETGTGAQPATADRVLDYDAANRLTRISGPSGDTTYTWNDRDLLAASSGAGGNATFGYDGDGRVISRTDTSGSATFTYDPAGRLLTAGDPLTGLAQTRTYDPTTGLLNSIRLGATGMQRIYSYNDPYLRMTGDTVKKGDGTTIASTTYGYDSDDLLTSKTTAGYAGSGTNQYRYDGLGRLISWTRPDSQVLAYGYDAASNRTTVTGPDGVRTSTYDERNRLLSVTGGGAATETYGWSARGTIASMTRAGTTTTYEFDAFERLTKAQASGYTVDYSYDALDRLAQRNGLTVQYSDLTNNAVRNPLASDDALVFRLPDGEPVATKVGAGQGQALVADPVHGDGIATADPATGSVAASTSYDPWGERAASSGTVPIGYQGGYTDPDTGLTNAHARWYAPDRGGFASRDTWTLDPAPVVQTNRYLYANAAPTVNNDPSGHTCNRAQGECPERDNGGGGSPSERDCLVRLGEPCSSPPIPCSELVSVGSGSRCAVDRLEHLPRNSLERNNTRTGGKSSGAGKSSGGSTSSRGSARPSGPPPVAARKPVGSEPSQRPDTVDIGGTGVVNPDGAPTPPTVSQCDTGCGGSTAPVHHGVTLPSLPDPPLDPSAPDGSGFPFCGPIVDVCPQTPFLRCITHPDAGECDALRQLLDLLHNFMEEICAALGSKAGMVCLCVDYPDQCWRIDWEGLMDLCRQYCGDILAVVAAIGSVFACVETALIFCVIMSGLLWGLYGVAECVLADKSITTLGEVWRKCWPAFRKGFIGGAAGGLFGRLPWKKWFGPKGTGKGRPGNGPPGTGRRPSGPGLPCNPTTC